MEYENNEPLAQERMAALGGRLQKIAEDRVAQRAEIEKRWLEDMYQYNGQYDPQTKAQLDADDNSSKVFVNITRPQTNTVEARLIDMLFPTDDKNWGIQPTPVPELLEGAKSADPQVQDQAQELLKKARQRAEAMEKEIDDQLKEATYNIKSRDLIHQACMLGTGVIKAPVVVNNDRRKWGADGVTQDGTEIYSLTRVEKKRPSVEVVDVWNFFPDMTVPNLDDGESTMERHYLTRKQVRALLKRPGFNPQAVKDLLQMDPKEYRSTSSHLNDLRAIAGLSAAQDDKRYEVWEYHGPVDKEDLVACGCDVDEDDPLEEYEGVIWFCGPLVLKAIINPMESGDNPYSIFCYEKDDTSPFGFGIPYELRHAQRVINAAWRMTLENGALSVGPQLVIDTSAVTPADGDWTLRPRKVWYFNSNHGARQTNQVFAAIDIPSRQDQLQNILLMALRLADQETANPIIAQGDNAQHMPDTARGMSMLMNNANAVTRRVVKNFDDDITTPVITRFYDWNMQFSPRNEIKGDYEVVARGTAALMVKEQQQQSLLQFMGMTLNDVDVAYMRRPELLRKTAQAMHLDAEELILTDEEIEAQQQRAAKQQQQGAADPNLLAKLDLEYKIHQEKLQDAQVEREYRMQERYLELDTAMAKLAQERDLTIEQLQGRLKEVLMNNQTRRQNFVDEVMVKTRLGAGI